MGDIKLIPLIDTLRLEKIDDSVYFSEKYSGYISNSRLSRIDPDKGGSPEEFFGRMKPFYTSSLQIGSCVHELTLQSDLFVLSEIDKPTAKMGILADKLYSLGHYPSREEVLSAAKEIDYYKGNLSENQLENVFKQCEQYWMERGNFEASNSEVREVIYLDKKSREIALNCVTALRNNKWIQELLHPKTLLGEPCISEMEQAILLDIKVIMPNSNEFILRFKAKLDNYTIDTMSNEIVINDIKTLGKILSEFDNNISRFSYNREIAIYSWLLSLCAKKYYNMDNPTIKGNYLVVSTVPQYYTKVVSMTPSMYREGWKDFRRLLRIVSYYYNKGYRFE